MGTHSLPPDAAHLYWFPLDVPEERRSELAACLSSDERARFGRLIRELDRDRYSVARATLRRILAKYASQAASEIVFRQGAHGKPYVASEGDRLPLEFNLSHSAGYGVIVVARAPVGVDIEIVRDDVKDSVAQRYFSNEEQLALSAVPSDEKSWQFFRTWTRKEAFLKGIGSGLTIRASSVSIQHHHPVGHRDERLRVHAPELDPEPQNWSIRDLELEPALAAALAFRGKLAHLEIEPLPIV